MSIQLVTSVTVQSQYLWCIEPIHVQTGFETTHAATHANFSGKSLIILRVFCFKLRAKCKMCRPAYDNMHSIWVVEHFALFALQQTADVSAFTGSSCFTTQKHTAQPQLTCQYWMSCWLAAKIASAYVISSCVFCRYIVDRKQPKTRTNWALLDTYSWLFNSSRGMKL